MISLILAEKKYKIFMSKTMFSLYLVYSGIFLVLNLCLYGDYHTDKSNETNLNNLFL